MLVKLFSLALITSGLVIISIATVRYHKLVRSNLQEDDYANLEFKRKSQLLSLALTYLFIFGFIVGFIDTLVRDVEPIYTFVVVVFFCGAIFIYASVSSQASMAALLRQKTMEVMKTFVNAIDMKDSYTKGHSEHVYNLVRLLYDKLPEGKRHKINRTKLLDAAMLHDCGKLSIKDDVLNKPGKLSEQDWEVMRTHPAQGKKMLDDTCLRDISDWVLYHHERMDGNGYYMLPGNKIPLESRIIAIADTYSALCTDRVYRRRFSHQKALEVMRQAAGTQLDTELLRCFMEIEYAELGALLPEKADEPQDAGAVLVAEPTPYAAGKAKYYLQ